MSEERWRLQSALNRALALYLHGADLPRASRVLFPFAPARGGEEELARGYRALAGMPAPEGPCAEIAVPAWDERLHGTVAGLRAVRARLLDAARRAGLELFLHGSFASLDFTGYSDLDTLVLLPGEAVCDPAALRRCRRALVDSWRAVKAFDPLQHHGHFVLTEIDLAGYPEPLFPRVVLERAVALDARARTLRVRACPAPALAVERFEDVARRFLATDLRRGLANAYRLKSDLSVFMLLPALWWQARGRPLDKKRSFEAVYAVLSPAAVATFRRAAAIRERWRYAEPPWNRWLRRVWINPLLPAAFDAAAARPPVEAVRRLVDPSFLEGTKAAVRELLGGLDGRKAGAAATRDSVA